MEKQLIVDGINETLSEEFELGIDKLTPDAHLFDDLGLDSLDAVDMLVHIEDKTGVKMDVEQFQKVKTLGDVYDLVAEVSSQSKLN